MDLYCVYTDRVNLKLSSASFLCLPSERSSLGANLGHFPFVRTDWPDYSRRNDNFTLNQTYPAWSMHEGDGFLAKTLGKSRCHFQTDWSSHGPAGQFWQMESTLSAILWEFIYAVSYRCMWHWFKRPTRLVTFQYLANDLLMIFRHYFSHNWQTRRINVTLRVQ